MLDHDSGHSVDLQKYVRTPVVQLVRIGRLAIEGSTTWIVIEIEVSQPNHFLQNHQHNNQKISLHQTEAKYCCESIQQG